MELSKARRISTPRKTLDVVDLKVDLKDDGNDTVRSHLRRVLGSLVIPVLVVGDPRNSAMQILNLHRALRVQLLKLLLEVLLYLGADIVRVLRGHETAYSRRSAAIDR